MDTYVDSNLIMEFNEKFSKLNEHKIDFNLIYDFEVEISKELMEIEDSIVFTEFDIKKMFNEIVSEKNIDDYYNYYEKCYSYVTKLEDFVLRMKLLFYKSSYFSIILKDKNINNQQLNNVIGRLEENNKNMNNVVHIINDLINNVKVCSNLLIQKQDTIDVAVKDDRRILVKFKKRIVSTILLCNMLLSSMGAIGETVKSIEGNVNVRSEASTSSSKVGKIYEDETAYRIGKANDDWDLVIANDSVGYVSSSLIEPSNEEIDVPYGFKEYNSFCKISCDNLNVRVLPTTDANVIYQLSNGDVAKILGIMDDGWYLVSIAGKMVGFILGNYTNIVSEDEYNIAIEEGIREREQEAILREQLMNQILFYVKVTADEANIRIGPGVVYSKIGSVRHDTVLGVLSSKDGFYQIVDSSMNMGYISGELVTRRGKFHDDFMYTAMVKTNELNVRSTPDKSIDYNKIYLLKKYEIVEVLEDCSDWVQVIYYTDDNNSGIGYVYKDNLRKITESYVETDISEQKVRYVVVDDSDTYIVFECDVVTGMKNVTDTPTGEFKIKNKKLNHVMVSKKYGYNTPTIEAMEFYDHCYFHDFANGDRKKYGGNVYLTNGSHGCVNMRQRDINALWDLVDVGTKVINHR